MKRNHWEARRHHVWIMVWKDGSNHQQEEKQNVQVLGKQERG
jgi:hypothetical protein